MDPLDGRYTQNTAYQPQHDGTFWILSDADGWGAALDDPVYHIWSACDGRPTARVINALTEEANLSPAFIESTLKVLARAGMLNPSQPLDPFARPRPVEISELPSLPLVSIIILASRQARVHLETCLPSVLAQTYPNLEIILVDNQTTDDSAAFTEINFPSVKVLPTPDPLGFGGANNYAMKRAQGKFFFLVNEDTEMEPDCIAECVRKMLQSENVAIVAPKMKLFYMRPFINSMGNSIHPNGHSHDNFIGYLDAGQFDDTGQVFAVCFGAAMLRRSVVEQIGYLDEKYFVYYDDVDCSLRARLCGYDLVAAPQAVVYHKFNATVNTMASTFKLDLIVRNRLRFIWKNLDFRRAREFARIYQEQDRRNVAQAKEEGMEEVLETYRTSKRAWRRSWPELALARWRTRGLRTSSFSDDAMFALTDGLPRPAMYGRYPVIFAPAIRGHYMNVEAFRPDSPPAPEDLAVNFTAAADANLSIGQKVRRTWREKGAFGLVRETGQYLCWRWFTSNPGI
ncbi:MAG TPA: glycosyltransferase family 2 protein [Chloroflexi bacterium]|nr:glycosyltransferase family 2 protein [Chloroflexota bacterium]